MHGKERCASCVRKYKFLRMSFTTNSRIHGCQDNPNTLLSVFECRNFLILGMT